MPHERFEFETDFSETTSVEIDHEILAKQNDRVGLAYRTGFEDGKRHCKDESLTKFEAMIQEIRKEISILEMERADHSERLFETLSVSLNQFLSHYIKETNLVTFIQSDSFGFRTLLETLKTTETIRIFVSPTFQKTAVDNETIRGIDLEPFIVDEQLSDHSFEIRWHTGGIIFESTNIFAAYKDAIEKVRSQRE